MIKRDFLQELRSHLKGISSEEREDILQDFEEHFSLGLEEGKTEEEISLALGAPKQIAKEMLASYHLEKVETTTTTGNIIRAVWAVIGLGFFNLVIVLGPFIALVGILFAGWVTGIVFIASPLLVLFDAVIHPGTFVLFELFFSIALTGLGLFIAIGMYFATRALMNGFMRYLAFNTRLIKGGVHHA